LSEIKWGQSQIKLQSNFNLTLTPFNFGFTLLELLIVLVILGFSSSLTMPDLWRSYEKAQQKNTIQQFAIALNKYRTDAYKAGQIIEVSADSEVSENSRLKSLPELPEGWKIKTNNILRFLPTGVTNGAQYKISSPNRQWQLTITPLDGRHEIQLQ